MVECYGYFVNFWLEKGSDGSLGGRGGMSKRSSGNIRNSEAEIVTPVHNLFQL